MRDPRFDPRQWTALVRLPGVIYHAVAMADGRADHQEGSRFLEHVNQTTPVDPLLRAVYDTLVEDGEDALKLSDHERDYPAYLAESRTLLEAKLSPGERQSFLAGMLGLGHHVAAASGGFLGLGNKVSAAESARLEEISRALGLTELLDAQS